MSDTRLRISQLPTTITAFRTGDYIAVDGTDTAKMSKDSLLAITAQNTLAGNVAPAFDPTRTSENPYKAGESVTYEGKVYTFIVDHYGSWDSSVVGATPTADAIDIVSKALCSSVGPLTIRNASDIVLGSPTVTPDGFIIYASTTRACTLSCISTKYFSLVFNDKYKVSFRYYDAYGRCAAYSGWNYSTSKYKVDTSYSFVRVVFANAQDDTSNIDIEDLKKSVSIFSLPLNDLMVVYGGLSSDKPYPNMPIINSVNRVNIPGAFSCQKKTILQIPSGYQGMFRFYFSDGRISKVVIADGDVDVIAESGYTASFFQVGFKKSDDSDFSTDDIDALVLGLGLVYGSVEPKKFVNYEFSRSGSFVDPTSTTYVRTQQIPVKLGDYFEFNVRVKGSYCLIFVDAFGHIVERRFMLAGASKTLSSHIAISNPNVKSIVFQCQDSSHPEYVADDYFVHKILNLDTYSKPQVPCTLQPVATLSLRSAKMIATLGGTPPMVDWYLVADPLTGKFYATKDFKSCEYLFTWECADSFFAYSIGIRPNGDIIAVYRTEIIEPPSGSDDGVKRNPIVYLAEEGYAIRHEVDFGSAMKPSGWLLNTGYTNLDDGSSVFCEYTRPSVATANVWRIPKGADLLDPDSWAITKSFTLSGDITNGFKHCHGVNQDFFTGVLYLFTGDDDVGAQMWHSLDRGVTWVQTRESSEKYCRMLNLVFTEDYIYWATDTAVYEKHFVFRCPRNSSGVLDYANIEELAQVPSTDDNLATYGCCYFKELNILFLAERCDGYGSATEMPVRVFDLDDMTLKTIGTFKSVGGVPCHLGLRTDFTEFYPIDSVAHFGFGTKFTRSFQNNFIEGLGNMGSQEDADTNVNTLSIRLGRSSNSIHYKLGSIQKMVEND